MSRKISFGVVLAILMLGGFFAYRYHEANKDFTPWLTHDKFELWLKENAAGKPLYISAAEGRLHHGVSEWRVRTHPSPQNVEWYWYWWYDMDEEFYNARVKDLVEKKGFTQIWKQSFINEKGAQDYQSIFLKIIKKGDNPK